MFVDSKSEFTNFKIITPNNIFRGYPEINDVKTRARVEYEFLPVSCQHSHDVVSSLMFQSSKFKTQIHFDVIKSIIAKTYSRELFEQEYQSH